MEDPAQIHNIQPKIGDKFYMNFSQESFKEPQRNAAFLWQKNAVESAKAWADDEDEPWLVVECRVVEMKRPPHRAPEFRK